MTLVTVLVGPELLFTGLSVWQSPRTAGMFLLAGGRLCDQLYQMNIGNEISIRSSDSQSVSPNGPY